MNTRLALILALTGAAAFAVEPAARAPLHGASSHEAANCCAESRTGGRGPSMETAPSGSSIYQLGSTWTDDSGRSVRLGSFAGHPVVLAMFYARCSSACPLLVRQMRQLREMLPTSARARTRFVLVSIDPSDDTPAALKDYRQRMGLGRGWTLLNGNAADVRELAMVLGLNYQEIKPGLYSHGNLITVLNGSGEIAYQKAGLADELADSVNAVVAAAR